MELQVSNINRNTFFKEGLNMSAKYSFFKLLESKKKVRKILWAPCIYDALSAACAEACGFEAVTISSGELTNAMVGVPCGLQTFDELAYATEKICQATSMAVLCDGENGGATPEKVYRFVKKIAEVGAMAVTIEDTNSELIGKANAVSNVYKGENNKVIPLNSKYMDADLWATNVRAAVEAVKGTECMVIARVDSKGAAEGLFNKLLGNGLGLDEAIRRAQMGYKAGAPMTMIQSVAGGDNRREWEEICKRVPGYHVFPDIMSSNGKSDADVQDLYDMGYQMVTCHGFMRGAFKGLMEYGRHIMEDQNTIFVDEDEFGGFPKNYFNTMFWPEYIERNNMYIDFYEKIKNYKERPVKPSEVK